MRTDCTRDRQKTLCRNASTLGEGTIWATPGSWVQYTESVETGDGRADRYRCGRVVGRVHCEGRTWLEVIALLGAADCPAVRWIDPDSVTVCKHFPPYLEFAFMCGPWDSAESILARVQYGFPCESVIRGRHS